MADYDLMTDEELRARYPGAPADMDLRAQQRAQGKVDISPIGKAMLGTEGPGRQPKEPEQKLTPPDDPADTFVVKPEWREPASTPQNDSIFSGTTSAPSPGGDEFQPPSGSRTGAREKQSTFFGSFSVGVEVTRVYDGDTFFVNLPGKSKPQSVRIRGIDAPELLNEKGPQARAALEAMLKRGGVRLSAVSEDRYGRAFATVSVNGIPDVGEALTKAGFATNVNLPKDWPQGNDWRKIRATAPADKRAYIDWIADTSQKMGALIHRGLNKADSKQYATFLDHAEKFMREYLRPWRKAYGIVPPGYPQSGAAPSPPSSPTTPGAEPKGDEPPAFNWKETFYNLDRPRGRSETASWEKSLWPEERQKWREIQAGTEYFQHYAAYAKQNPQFAKLREELMHKRERFLNLTTKRWRKYKDRYQPNSRSRGGGRRYGENAPQVQQTIAKEWRTVGMSNNGIAGLLQNVADESSFNPNLRHPDQPRWRGEAHYAHGLFQEGGAEWNRYANWLKTHHPNEDWRNPQLQSRFTALNLKQNYPQVWHSMQNARTPGEAAVAFLSGYLKPAAHHMRNRTNRYRQGVQFRVAEGGDEDMQQALSAVS